MVNLACTTWDNSYTNYTIKVERMYTLLTLSGVTLFISEFLKNILTLKRLLCDM